MGFLKKQKKEMHITFKHRECDTNISLWKLDTLEQFFKHPSEIRFNYAYK